MVFWQTPTPILRTERLELRLPHKKDFHSWAEIRKNNEEFLQKWEPLWRDDHLWASSFHRRVRWARAAANNNRAYGFLIFRRADNQILGGATLENIQKGASACASIGYWIGEEHAQRGYMTEAIRAVIKFAFNEVDISRIEAACIADNAPSIALLNKLGFKCEGTAKAFLQVDSEWRDHLQFAFCKEGRENNSFAL